MTHSDFADILKMSFNVEMPAAGADNPCLAVEEVWRTSTTYFTKIVNLYVRNWT